MAIENYVGKGLVFPIQIDSLGAPVIKTGFELINSSIKMILAWEFRHRIFLSEFGSRLGDLLEEPNDDLLQRTVEHFTFDALSTWEKRINILEIIAQRKSNSKLTLSIRYSIKNSNLETTFIFPFYKEILN